MAKDFLGTDPDGTDRPVKRLALSAMYLPGRKTVPFENNRSPQMQLHRSSLLVVLIVASAITAPGQHNSLTIRVVAPPATPADARIVVVGNDSLWGDWDPTYGVALAKENDSVWAVTRQVSTGFTLECKVTRGSWPAEAIYEPGKRPSNTSIVVRADTVVTFRPINWFDFVTPVAGKIGGIVGTVRYHHAMESDKLKYTRDVIVWLPPSYFKARARRYPVLYMHDGQNIVDPTTSAFGFDWRADEVTDSLIRAKTMREIIIVGIYNTPDRSVEYAGTQQGHHYADFVVHTLKPFIDKRYRTQSDAAHTAVMGASLGGLISFLFVWWYPDVFSQAGCLSGAFQPEISTILEEVQAYSGVKKRIRTYIDVGGRGIDSRLKPGSEKMFSLLQAKGYAEGKDVEFYYDPGAEHNEQAWAARLWRPLIFMFGQKNNQ